MKSVPHNKNTVMMSSPNVPIEELPPCQTKKKRNNSNASVQKHSSLATDAPRENPMKILSKAARQQLQRQEETATSPFPTTVQDPREPVSLISHDDAASEADTLVQSMDDPDDIVSCDDENTIKSETLFKRRSNHKIKRPQLDRRDSEKRWSSDGGDSGGIKERGSENDESGSSEIGLDDAISVGFAVLRALKTSSAKDDEGDSLLSHGKKGNKEDILNHLHNIINRESEETVASTTVLGMVESCMNAEDKPVASKSNGSSHGAPSIPSRTVDDVEEILIEELKGESLSKPKSVDNASFGDLSFPPPLMNMSIGDLSFSQELQLSSRGDDLNAPSDVGEDLADAEDVSIPPLVDIQTPEQKIKSTNRVLNLYEAFPMVQPVLAKRPKKSDGTGHVDLKRRHSLGSAADMHLGTSSDSRRQRKSSAMDCSGHSASSRASSKGRRRASSSASKPVRSKSLTNESHRSSSAQRKKSGMDSSNHSSSSKRHRRTSSVGKTKPTSFQRSQSLKGLYMEGSLSSDTFCAGDEASGITKPKSCGSLNSLSKRRERRSTSERSPGPRRSMLVLDDASKRSGHSRRSNGSAHSRTVAERLAAGSIMSEDASTVRSRAGSAHARRVLEDSPLNLEVMSFSSNQSDEMSLPPEGKEFFPGILPPDNRIIDALCSPRQTRSSMTRREIRKLLPQKKMLGDRETDEEPPFAPVIEIPTPFSPRRGRRPSSVRGTGSIQNPQTRRSSRPKPVSDINSVVPKSSRPTAPPRGRHPLAASEPPKRSLSLDAVQMRLETTVTVETKEEYIPRPSLSKVQWNSLRTLAVSGAALRSSIFSPRPGKYMDVDGRETSTIHALAEQNLLANRTKSPDPVSARKLNTLPIPPPPPFPPESPSILMSPVRTPKLTPSSRDTKSLTTPGSLSRRATYNKSPGRPPLVLGVTEPTPLMRKSLSAGNLQDVLAAPSSTGRRRTSTGVHGDAARLDWQRHPSSANAAAASPGTRKAKKGTKLKKLLKLQSKSSPLADQQPNDDDDDDESILVPLHFLDAEREITRKPKIEVETTKN